MTTGQTQTPTRRFPIETIALLALAGFFYVGMLMSINPSGSGGEAAISEAMGWLVFTAALWIVLTVMLIVCRLMGKMPRGIGVFLVVLQPLAGAAILVSGDFYSRHRNLPIVEPALLPLLIAFYAVWARFPALHRRLPPILTSVGVWGLVFVLSVVSLVVPSFY
jgi:hypothetical protein